ncbi:hypothetical protein, partial [Bifidobacterium actinocoloniiforme]|uniref:hypothetical protein n=1 Tax=Bifidobacterium actinocoloniiforme TaxID=638619 RepID=UPI0019D3644E
MLILPQTTSFPAAPHPLSQERSSECQVLPYFFGGTNTEEKYSRPGRMIPTTPELTVRILRGHDTQGLSLNVSRETF